MVVGWLGGWANPPPPPCGGWGGWWGGGVVGWWGGVVGWWGGGVVGWWGGGVVGWWGGGVVGWWGGCRVVWFRVGCCERCGGVGSRGERGVWDRSCRARTVLDSIPSIASIIPKMRMMRGSGGTIPLGGGGGGTWPRDWYIYTYLFFSRAGKELCLDP